MKNDLLLPSKLKSSGYFLLLVGFTLILLRYQYNYKPDFLNLKLFALYTYYIESKSFTIVSNQMIEELGAIFSLAGLAMLAFTREQNESEVVDAVRLKSFILASYVNLVFLLISLLFFFGFGFVGALTAYMGVWLLSYLLIFRYLIYKRKRILKSKE